MGRNPPDAYILTFGNQTGGVETWIRDFLFFTRGRYQLLPEEESLSSIFSLRSPVEDQMTERTMTNRPLVKLVNLVRQLMVLRKSDPILHAHNLKLALVALTFAPSSKLIYFSHNNFGRQLAYQAFLKRQLYFFLERLVLRRCSNVFTFSREDSERISSVRPNVETLLGSYNDVLFPSSQVDHKAPRSGLVWIGRLSPVKNPLLAIHAFELFALNKDTTLTIVGDGPLRRNLWRAISKSPIQQRIFVTGSLAPNEVQSLLTKSEALLVTSLSEGPTPRNVYEAIASGTPVVSTRPGDPNLIIEEAKAGVVTGKFTPTAMAEAVEKCLTTNHKIDPAAIRDARASSFFPKLEERLQQTMG